MYPLKLRQSLSAVPPAGISAAARRSASGSLATQIVAPAAVALGFRFHSFFEITL